MKKQYYIMFHQFEQGKAPGQLINTLHFVCSIQPDGVDVCTGIDLARLFDTEEKAVSYLALKANDNECFEVRSFYVKTSFANIITG